MGLTIKHPFVSGKADGGDASLVRPGNWNADHEVTGSGFFTPGMMIDYVGHTVPDDFLEGYGQSVAAATYPELFAAMVKQSVVTITIANPVIVNWVGHNLRPNSKVRFSTTGTLPTGLVAGTDYYVAAASYATDAFSLSTTPGGSTFSVSGGQSGTHTAIHAQFGVSSDLSTFTVPDTRGRVTAGFELMGGTTSSRLTLTAGGVLGSQLGGVGGAQNHTITMTELPSEGLNIPGDTFATDAVGNHTHTGPSHTHSFSATTSTATPLASFITSDAGNFQGGGSKYGLDGWTTSGPSHNHTVSGTTGSSGTGNTGGAGGHSHTVVIPEYETDPLGDDTPHNNVQPTIIVRKLIYAG